MKNKRLILISNISIAIIYLALFRSLAEPFRLQYTSNQPLSFDAVKPFLMASMACGLGLLGMNLSSHFKRYWLTIGISLSTVIGMIIIKIIYLD